MKKDLDLFGLCLNPDIKYDLNKWMNGFDAELDDIDLENWHFLKA